MAGSIVNVAVSPEGKVEVGHEVVVFVILFKVIFGLGRPDAKVFVVMDFVIGPVPVTVVADDPVTV